MGQILNISCDVVVEMTGISYCRSGDKHVAYPGVFIGSGAPDMLSLLDGSERFRDGLREAFVVLLLSRIGGAGVVWRGGSDGQDDHDG